MTTQPTNLPFNLEPEFDYILNDDDRKQFAPKLAMDEFWSLTSEKWLPIDNAERFLSIIYYRRRKSSGWVSVKERLPEANTPFMAACGKIVDAYQKGWADPSNLLHTDFTHWQPWTLPALPQPPKPAAEVAFEQFLNSAGIGTHALTAACKAWKAGIAWAKENRGAL